MQRKEKALVVNFFFYNSQSYTPPLELPVCCCISTVTAGRLSSHSNCFNRTGLKYSSVVIIDQQISFYKPN